MAVKKSLLLFLLLAAPVSVLNAQISPAATSTSTVYIGALPTTVNPDWGCPGDSPVSCWNRQLLGLEAYAGTNHVWNRVGLEADARWLVWRGVQVPTGNLKEYTYGIGPSVRIYTRRWLTVAGDVPIGIGSISIPKGYGPGDGIHFMYNPGIQIEQRLTSKLYVRYQYEYQIWPGFAGTKGTRGLTPNGIGVGLTYRLSQND